jgi:hypothetical protein
MDRTEWTDERLDERMTAIDQTFERIFDELGGIRDDIRGLRGEISSLRGDIASVQDRLIQIGFGLAGVLITALIALVVAVAA